MLLTLHHLSTLHEKLNALHAQGYCQSFTVRDNILCATDGAQFMACDIAAVEWHVHYDTDNLPGGDVIMYMLTTTNATKGLMLDIHGSYGDIDTHNFIENAQNHLSVNC